jgi:hypothetical protein
MHYRARQKGKCSKDGLIFENCASGRMLAQNCLDQALLVLLPFLLRAKVLSHLAVGHVGWVGCFLKLKKKITN